MTLLGEYTLDNFQFFIPSSLKISSHLKQQCPGSKNFRKNCVPVIYSEDFKNTLGVLRLPLHHVLSPEYFGHTLEDLNWLYKNKEFLIPSEQMGLRVVIQPPLLKFIIITQKQGSEQYHIEFSSSKNVLAQKNLMALHLKYLDFRDLILKLKPYVNSHAGSIVDYSTEQAPIEKEYIKYSAIPVHQYSFNLSKFKYLVDFLQHNRTKINVPVLSYNSTMAPSEEASASILKFGRTLSSFLNGKPLCRVQIFFMVSHPNFKKSMESKVVTSGDTVDQKATDDIFFEIKIEDFLNMFYTYNEKFGPLYLW